MAAEWSTASVGAAAAIAGFAAAAVTRAAAADDANVSLMHDRVADDSLVAEVAVLGVELGCLVQELRTGLGVEAGIEGPPVEGTSLGEAIGAPVYAPLLPGHGRGGPAMGAATVITARSCNTRSPV